jgi:hypothetical protein
MKKLIVSVIAVTAIVSCGSGSDDDYSCGPFGSPRYDIVGMNVKPTTYEQMPENLGRPVATINLDAANTISNGNFILVFTADTTSNPTNAPSLARQSFRFNFSLLSSAYACSPPMPYTDELLSAINITSDSDFSADYPAGSDLNALFDMQYHENGTLLKTDANGERSHYTLSEYNELSYAATQYFQLRLNQAPQNGSHHQFSIEYMHKDGEHYSMSTEVISFE